MKIATFNVNSIRSRLHIVIPWLKENSPDVLCLQETKVSDRQFPEADFHRIGYNVYFSGNKGLNGVAIASLEEAKEIIKGLNSEPADKDRLILAKYDKFNVVNTYIPQGFKIDSPKFEYKIKWYARLKNFFESNIAQNNNKLEKIIWCGDLNVAPEDIDVHNPNGLKNHVCFHERTKTAFNEVKSLGFVDIFRKHHPEPEQYTFYDYRTQDVVQKKKGWRVDLILATHDLAEKSVDSYIDIKTRLQKKPSDHVVLVSEFDI